MGYYSASCMVGVQEVAIIIMLITRIVFVIYKVLLGVAVNSDQGWGSLLREIVSRVLHLQTIWQGCQGGSSALRECLISWPQKAHSRVNFYEY